LPYNEISAQGIEMQVIDVYVKYLSPSRFDDEIVVKVWIEKVGRASCRFGYQIINETTGKLCVEAATEHAAEAHDGKIKRFFPKLYDTLITHAGTFPETYFSRKNKEKAK
jgi:acyl-CoA thioester hydrolase